MPRKSNPAHQQFVDLGIPEADWTDTMRLAVKQKWSNLPIDEKVDDLRARVAAVQTPPTPTVDDLVAADFADGDQEACAKEAARLRRNAAVNAWRERCQLQAALDAREARYAALRSKRKASGKKAGAKASA